MSRKTGEQQDARDLQKNFGVTYSTALRLVRVLGLEGAIQQLEEWKKERIVTRREKA